MKTILKRLFLFVLVVSMVMPTINVSATNIESALFKTEALELFEKEPDGTIDWSKTITRAEFSHAIGKLLGHDNYTVSYPLNDVNETTPYRGDIYNMLMFGLMSGDGNGYFRPYDNITVVEASIVMLRVMGYTYVVAEKQYPTGVIAYAASLGLAQNVNATKEITRQDFAIMLNNALDINLMSEMYVSGESRQFYVSDIKFGDVVFNANGEGSAYYGVGIVMQNALSFVDVPYRTLEINEVIIDGVLYDAGKINVADLLGMEVRYLAKEKADGSYQLISIAPTNDNNIVKFDANNFNEYAHQSRISYYDQNDKVRKINLNSDTKIIKNYDVIVTPSDSIFAMDCGEYIVIDNDDDNIAELIMMYSYENAVVSGVANNVIALKEGFKVNGSRYINLDESNDELLYSVVDVAGNGIDVDSITGGNVISVATDLSGKIMKIVVNTADILTRKLDATIRDQFIIGDNEYSVLCTDDYTLGSLYDFYINFKNEIIYFEIADEGEETKYCYVLGATSKHFGKNQIKLLVSKKVDFGIEVDDADEDNITQIPMLICQNEEIIILDMADKVKINGSKVDNEDVENIVSNSDMIYKFELNSDGELRTLETPEFKAGSLYQPYKYNIYDKCFGVGNVIWEGIAINEKSQILCLPTTPSCDEDYMVKNVINKEGNELGYLVRGYNYDPITKKCGLIIINRDMKHDNLPGVTLNSSKIAIVKDFSMALLDDIVVGKVEFAIAGEDKEMYLTETATEAVGMLSEGDIFAYTEDYDDNITNILVIKSMAKLNDSFSDAVGFASGASETFGQLLDIAFDEIDEINNCLAMEFSIDVNGVEKVINVPQRNKPPIYIYHRNEIRNGKIEDIVPGSDKVYVLMSGANTVAAVVAIK